MVSRIVVAIVGMLPRGLIKRIGMMQAKSPMLHRWVVGCRRLVQGGDLIIQQGEGAGLKFHPGESNFGYVTGTSEPETQAAMKAHIRSGTCFWDIGCNVGFMTVLGSRMVGPRGQVYSFDPVPKHTQATEHNVQSNNFTQTKVVQMAISDKPGTAKFAVQAIASQSTLIESGMNREGATIIEVRTASVDDLIEHEGFRAPDAVKIDVEGAEVDVLKGMYKTLRKNHPTIILDTHGEHMKCAQLLNEAGYFCATSDHPNKAVEESEYYCQILATWDATRAPSESAKATASV